MHCGKIYPGNSAKVSWKKKIGGDQFREVLEKETLEEIAVNIIMGVGGER